MSFHHIEDTVIRVGDTVRPKPAGSKTPVVVIILLAILVVVGGVGGFIFSGLGKPSGPETAGPVEPGSSGAPTGNSPAPPVTIPVDLLAGLPAPDYVDWAGESGGIAVFRLGYISRQGVPGDNDYAGGGVGHEILRGVDAATGQVVWSNDQLPADSLVGSTMVADGKLALTLTEARRSGGSVPWACVAAGVRVLSVATGEVLSRLSTPVGADCSQEGSFQPPTTYAISGYQDGLLALAWVTDNYWLSEVSVYRDSDLTKPVWRGDGSGRPSFQIGFSDLALPGGWIMDRSGTYRSLRDGTASKMTVLQEELADGNIDYNLFRGVGGKIVEVTGRVEHGASALSLIDPATGVRTWTYRVPDEWGALPGSCLAATRDSLVVRADKLFSSDTVVSAINLATGQLRWSVPIPRERSATDCQVLSRLGDQQVIAIRNVAGIDLFDQTGAQIDAWRYGGSDYDAEISACGTNRLCAGSSGASAAPEAGGLRLTVLDYSSEGLKVVFDESGTSAGGRLNMVPTSRGRAVGFGHASGGYEFLYF